MSRVLATLAARFASIKLAAAIKAYSHARPIGLLLFGSQFRIGHPTDSVAELRVIPVRSTSAGTSRIDLTKWLNLRYRNPNAESNTNHQRDNDS